VVSGGSSEPWRVRCPQCPGAAPAGDPGQDGGQVGDVPVLLQPDVYLLLQLARLRHQDLGSRE